MPTQRDIRRRIKSASNIQQITRAMKMVAAAKLRRLQDRMLQVRVYADQLHLLLQKFLSGATGHEHPLLAEREGERTAVIVMTGDRGLCGAFNTNAIRKARNTLQQIGAPAAVYAVGKQGVDMCRKAKTKLAAGYTGLYDQPSFLDAQGIMRRISNAYLDGQFDRVIISRPRFINTMTQRFVVETILPLVQEEIVDEAKPEEEEKAYDVYVVEPSTRAMATELLARHLASQMYRSVIEAACCEFAARMVAMDLATDNAEEMIGQLTLEYNRARQSSITKEILDIVGGAEVLR